MPKQYLPPTEEVLRSYDDLYSIGFEQTTKSERISFLRYKKFVESVFATSRKKNIKKGLEDCLVYRQGQRIVCVFTSYVPEEGAMRENDFIWCLIVDLRYPTYPCFFTIPIRRTTNCLTRMFKRAKALKNMVDNWQTCPEHSVDLRIVLVEGGKMHESSYSCPVGGYHKGIPRWIYTDMLDEDRKVLELSFEAYQTYVDKEREAGHEHIPQRVLRAHGTTAAGYKKIKNKGPEVYNDSPHGENEHVDAPHTDD